MPVQWCGYSVYHSGKTKVGQKPSHPLENQRVDEELVKFINDTNGISFDSTAESIRGSGLLCLTCYEKESTRLDLNNASLKDIEEEYGLRDIDCNTAERRCTRTLVFTESSDDDSLFDKIGKSSFLPTSMEKNEV